MRKQDRVSSGGHKVKPKNDASIENKNYKTELERLQDDIDKYIGLPADQNSNQQNSGSILSALPGSDRIATQGTTIQGKYYNDRAVNKVEAVNQNSRVMEEDKSVAES